MEGDAGSGQLNPNPPVTGDEEEPVTFVPAVDDAEHSEAPRPEGKSDSLLTDAPWLARVCAALILASSLIFIAGGLALWGHLRHAAADRDDIAAVAAARECVAATQAPDAKAMAASATKIIECATGDFATQAKIYSGVLVDAYQAANAQVQVVDMRAAVERRNPDGTIDVLVAVRTKLSNTTQDGQEQGYRLRVKMAPDGGVYKVSRMDQVSQ